MKLVIILYTEKKNWKYFWKVALKHIEMRFQNKEEDFWTRVFLPGKVEISAREGIVRKGKRFNAASFLTKFEI